MALSTLFYDFRSPDLHLPTKSLWRRNCTCRFDKKDGFFVDDLQALVQIEYNHELFTLTVENTGGFLSKTTAFYRFYVDTFDDFESKLFDSLPDEIKKRYPYLSLAANPIRMYNGELVYDINPSTKFSFNLCHHAGEKAIFAMSDWLPIDGKELSIEQINGIENAIDFILKAEKDYNKYKSSRLYAVLQDKFKSFNESNSIGILVLFKLAKLAFSIYNGFSSNDDVVGWDSLDMPNIDSDSMADYLCDDYNSPYDSSTYDNTLYDNTLYDNTSYDKSDISFTGNGDKYTDNDHNQSLADQWMAEAEKRYQKGDKSGGDRAMAKANDYLRRIKH